MTTKYLGNVEVKLENSLSLSLSLSDRYWM